MVQEQLQSLEAEDLCLGESPAPTCQNPIEYEPKGEAALGWMLSVFCKADGCYYDGQLIAYKPTTGLHHILYQDGEDEWLCLQQEQVQWLQHLQKPSPAGLKQGEIYHPEGSLFGTPDDEGICTRRSDAPRLLALPSFTVCMRFCSKYRFH